MVGKKKWLCIFLMVACSIFLLNGCAETPASSEIDKNKVIKIGITQIAEHPALDAARKGFIDALHSKGFKDGENIKIDFQNAQEDMAVAQTIAQDFVSKKKDLILAIATQSAQAAFNVTKDIPIVITAVTDPVTAELVKSLEKPGTNVTGTSDASPIDKQFKLMKELVPNVKTVGILYNTRETNSEIQIKNAKEVAKQFNIEIISAGITTTNEVPQALKSLLNKIDVLYTPTDNKIAAAMPLVSSQCTEKNIPVIGAEEAHVRGGALATEGIDYYQLGVQTGNIAVEIINGKDPKDIPITTLEKTKLVINMDIAKKLNITIPQNLKEKAELIGVGE
jgi:putative ABC transport system substrate-binding protein